MSYATGSLPEAVALVAATHLTLCAPCRAQVEACEQVGGTLLDGLDAPGRVRAGAVEEALARIESSAERDVARAHAAAPRKPTVLPEPLRSYAGGDVSQLRWRFRAPGAREHVLPVSLGGVAARVVRLSTWLVIPRHTHREPEYTLVLAGGLRDEFGTFERGDLAVYDETVSHDQRVLPGEPCICLVVNSAPLVPLTLLGRVMSKIAGD